MADISAGADVYAVVSNLLGVSYNTALFIMVVISIWALVWKGLALWKSGRRTQKIWFVILLITNTMGILPIIYLLVYKGQTSDLIGKSKKKKK